VRTEVDALARDFDYSVPAGWEHEVGVGSRVRVPLHGRSVRGWVVESGAEPPSGVDLLPAKAWLGWGPPPPVVELARWAAWRWAGPESFFLAAGSPRTVVRRLPTPAAPPPRLAHADAGVDLDLAGDRAQLVRLPPATDLIDLVLSVIDDPVVRARRGTTVVLVPSLGWARRLRARLARRGCPAGATWE
jgi:primosomal protein N'